jgi:light-regulated signal transduction histidine kinase (bacteriophytochrome)
VRERTAQLEESNKELEAFSYSVSHDLRAPLRHISGFVSVLREDLQPDLAENNRHSLDVIIDSATRMGLLIDNLLSFSHVGRAEMCFAQVETDSLMREVLREVQVETKGRVIVWEVGPLPEVFGDRAMLKQVWLNLVSNAIKYTRRREQATIRIGAHARTDEVEFFVDDNGAGFNMNYAEKLFGVFQRLHRAEDFEGTGIGLANVRRIVARHGGRTWAEGKVDAGATFHFTLPNRVQP